MCRCEHEVTGGPLACQNCEGKSMRYAAKVDDNQRAIVDALRKVGCSVQSLAATGKGVPDLLVGFRGQNILLEVKDGSKPPSARKLTADQVQWHESWRGAVAVVESVDQARAIMIPAGVVITGAEIKIPTLLVISGDVLIYGTRGGDDGPVRFTGYHVALGAVGRKQAFYALADTHLTMLFATTVETVEAAEEAFTDEHERLLSRREA